MTSRTSTTSFGRLASTAALAAAVMLVGDGTARERQADACGWGGPELEELTTFDPSVAAEPTGPGLNYDPFVAGFGGPCDDCARTAMTADWNTYFGGQVSAADWDRVLLQASPKELSDLRRSVVTGTAAPRGLEPIAQAVAKRTSMREPMMRALAYVGLARRVEQIASLDNGASGATLTKLADDAKALSAAAAKAGNAFLQQRYAYQRLRIAFYRGDWAGAVTLFDRGGATFAGPSADLAARARYYVAGALRRKGDRARANLELARVHASAPALAGVTAQDFQPMEDQDWRATLALATTVRERTELWRLVGVKLDGLVAAQEIFKLDPASDLLGLLVVRELERAESSGVPPWDSAPDPSVVAAQRKAFAALEQLAVAIAAAPGADRPWLMELVAGHLAARRGDLAATRTRLAAAIAGRPGDAKVASQARASLAVAFVSGSKVSPKLADELARTMTAIDPDYGRLNALTQEVRRKLAADAIKRGRLVDAEFLVGGSADAGAHARGARSKWTDVAFLKQMIARTAKTRTPFDRFVLASNYTRVGLEHELAMRQLLDGDFASAAKGLARNAQATSRLGTDPFVAHIVDCHDCDHDAFGNAPWTEATVSARLAELHKRARGKGQAAAAAAFDLGTALYNLTWYGNARAVLEGTHQDSRDTAAAARWYKRAYELATDRDFKAKAAFFAAKTELAALITATYEPYEQADVLPVPTTWYPIVRSFKDTTYYREILAECGAYRVWAAAQP
ncbi:MAG: hypothetical protein IPL61_26225 [Myxococcales bacterium]|nr:hypothetical protein [Myxococcales bacterium]